MASTHEISIRVTSQISMYIYKHIHTHTNVWNVRAMPVSQTSYKRSCNTQRREVIRQSGRIQVAVEK